ncbi:MAG: cyclase family protein [Desulfovibrio sp.]
MKTIDLTLPLTHKMPVYPGDPAVSIKQTYTVDADHIQLHTLMLSTHSGTHMDAPAHILSNGRTLDTYPPEQFMGSALVISSPTASINLVTLQNHTDEIAKAEVLLFHTGHIAKWGKPEYFSTPTGLTPAGAEFLAQFQLKAVGGDFPSIDSTDSLQAHKTLLQNDILIYESLTNLHQLPAKGATFVGLPLPIQGSDGAPVRAIAYYQP